MSEDQPLDALNQRSDLLSSWVRERYQNELSAYINGLEANLSALPELPRHTPFRHYVTVSVDDDVYNELKAEAVRRGAPMTVVVRGWLEAARRLKRQYEPGAR